MWRSARSILSVSAVACLFLLTGCAEQAPSASTEVTPTNPTETLTGPEASAIAPESLSLAGSSLTDALSGRTEFSSVAVDEAGTGLVLYWYGAIPSAELASLASAYPDVSVEVRATSHVPGELRELASGLLEAEAAAGVGAVAVRTDGSGLDVYVHEDRVSESMGDMAVRLSASTGVDVAVAPGAPVPAM